MVLKRLTKLVISALILFWSLGLFTVLWDDPVAKSFLQKWWWALGLTIFFSISLLVVLGIWKALPVAGKIAIVVFGALPAALTMMAIVMSRSPETALRVTFLLGVCLLPAMLNYLFSVTRKGTLVHQFINNLERLGLVGESGGSPEAIRSRENRAYAYGEKFKALYGPASPETLIAFVPYAQPVVQALSSKAPDPTSKKLAEYFPLENAIPMILATVLIALGWFIALPPVRAPRAGELPALLQLLGPFAPDDNPVNFAFLGAYFFSLQMLYRRYVRMDLRGNAYISTVIRIIVAVIGTWAAVSFFTYFGKTGQVGVEREDLLLLGFGIGIFPPIVWQFVSNAFKGRFGASFPVLQTQLPLHDLDGLTVWYQDRLVEEDIENIPNMATADIVDLMLRTTLPADRIIDWVDQSILYTHLGASATKGTEDMESISDRGTLRKHGIRTASDLVTVLRRNPLLKTLLDEDHQESHRLASIAAAVWTNPNLPMILKWRGLREEPVPAYGAVPVVTPSTSLPLPLVSSPTPGDPAAVTVSPPDQKGDGNGAPVG